MIIDPSTLFVELFALTKVEFKHKITIMAITFASDIHFFIRIEFN
jgi:hypothetical protein